EDERARRLVTNALHAAQRGAKLTAQLLAFSRRQRLETRAVDLNALIAGMSDLLTSTLGGAIKVEHALAADLPLAVVDPAQVELALLNLAINARDAMGGDGVITLATRAVSLGEPGGLHEPEPGVANARNAALAVAKGAMIAFLDDDEEAPPGWLAALIAAQARLGADAVFGP
ncbi:glycosyltransferase, partial [Maribellus luteus]